MADVRLEHIKKSYGKTDVLHDIHFTVPDRSFTVFVGSSGCGKSTLLRMIAGLEEITAGKLFIDGECVNDLPPAKRGISMVFQSYALYPHMSVKENISFGLQQTGGFTKDEIKEKVGKAAEILQLSALLDRKPKELSGGQRQRVAIGRAIVRDPKVFLFDEPLSNLDASLRVQMRLEIARLKEELNATMIYVTHDQVEAMTLADQLVVLNKGYVSQIGSPLEVYQQPANQFVASFIGSPSMNFIHVNSDNGQLQLPNGPQLAIPAPAIKSEIILGVRPEDLTLGDPTGNALPVTVSHIEHLGNEAYAYAKTDDKQLVIIRLPADAATRKGDKVGLSVNQQACHLFDKEGRRLAA